MKIYFFDTETTGNDTEGRIIQLAIKERGVSTPVLNELFKAPHPIPAEASAVHHITNKMVANKPLFQESDIYNETKKLFENTENIVVAHNASFDVGMLMNENITAENIICTLKVSRALDVSNKFTNHKLQYLRYALDMELDVPAHDALADVLVLEQLFEYLLNKIITEKNISINEAVKLMKQITREPSLIKEIGFGKYKGKTIEEVSITDRGYLIWLLNEKKKKPEGEEDWIYTLEKYIKT